MVALRGMDGPQGAWINAPRWAQLAFFDQGPSRTCSPASVARPPTGRQPSELPLCNRVILDRSHLSHIRGQKKPISCLVAGSPYVSTP